MLLHVPGGQAGDERVRRARLGDDFLRREVEDDRLGGLGAGINADVEGHGGMQGVKLHGSLRRFPPRSEQISAPAFSGTIAHYAGREILDAR